MEMVGERRIAAPRETVWEALNDPETLRAAIPGCESVERDGPDAFTAKVAMKIGPMSAKFSGKVRIENAQPPESYTIVGEGNGGAMGFAKGGADVSLQEDGAETVLRYTVKAQVGGKIAQLGARLIDSTAKHMADQFFDRLARNLTPAEPEPVAADAGLDPVAASTGGPLPAVATAGAGRSTVRVAPAPDGASRDGTPDDLSRSAAPEDEANRRAGAAIHSPANRAATDQRVGAARTGEAARGTDTEYLGDPDPTGPITQHGADGMSPGGPVSRPNRTPADPEALRPLRLLFQIEPFGLPIQFWAGSVVMLVILALMFL